MGFTVLVTGCNGFVGRALVAELRARGDTVFGVVRERRGSSEPTERLFEVGPLQHVVHWASLLAGVDAIVHLAARCHVVRETAGDPVAEFTDVNVLGSLRIAEAAACAAVRRFVYVSTVGVHGERSRGRPLTEADPLSPRGPYARSKADAEQALARVAERTGLELAIVRPPLVYGPGAPGNFERLVRWVQKGLPMPFGAVRNRRSLLDVSRLAELLALCVRDPRAAGQAFLAADHDVVSTAEIVRAVARGLGTHPRLVPVPAALLRLGGSLVGRRSDVDRLVGDLEVDAAKARTMLGWVPRGSTIEKIQAAAASFTCEARR